MLDIKNIRDHQNAFEKGLIAKNVEMDLTKVIKLKPATHYRTGVVYWLAVVASAKNHVLCEGIQCDFSVFR